jgi:hypothetical protein
MRTAVSAPNKASEDIKLGGQAHADGAGHHMKTVAMKCNYSICCFWNSYLNIFLLFISKGLNRN